MAEGLHVVEPTEAHRAMVRATAPLAANLWMECGPFAVPVAACAVPGRAELESSATSDALRHFLDHNPWEGMGTVTKHDWLLLAGDDHTLVFGQRVDAVGIGAIVVMEESGGRFEPTGMGGWRLQFADPRYSAAVADSATTTGSTVTVKWECGAVDVRGGWQEAAVIARVELFETATEAHFLLVREPNPALPPLGPLRSSIEVGRSATATLDLREPLGHRALINDFRVPAQAVSIEGA